MLRRSRIFRDKTHPFDTGIRRWIHFAFWGNSDSDENNVVTITDYTEKALATSSRTGSWNWHHRCKPIYCTKVFASGGSFQDVCGELIGVGQNRPVQRPLFLTFCGERFATSQTLTFAVIPPRAVTLLASSPPDLLAVNTSVVQMPLPLTELFLLSAKFL